jgi:hypothetical protein
VTLALRGSAQASPDEFGFCQNGLAVVERRGERGFEEFVPAKVRRLTDALQAQNAALAGLGPMNGLYLPALSQFLYGTRRFQAKVNPTFYSKPIPYGKCCKQNPAGRRRPKLR